MTTQEKGFWHKTKEVGGSIWESTKNVTEEVWSETKNVAENVWDGTKNVAGSIRESFGGDESENEDFYEEVHYAASAPKEDACIIADAVKSKTAKRHKKN